MLIDLELPSSSSVVRSWLQKDSFIKLIGFSSISKLIFIHGLFAIAMDNCSFLTKITQTVRADVYNLADQKNEDSPTFLIDRTVCNYNENPVQIYTFERKIKRDEILLDDKKIEYTLTGDLDDKFTINKEMEDTGAEGYQLYVEVVLNEPLQIRQLVLQLNAIRVKQNGLDKDLRQTICEIKFKLTIEDCNSITWQTLTVIVLASLSVLLLSTLAIMLSVYHQKNLKSDYLDKDNPSNFDMNYRNDDRQYGSDHRKRRNSFDSNNTSGYDNSSYSQRDANMFITPRRSSYYDLTHLSRYPNSDVVDIDETKL